jgi:hypothetical protein
MVDRGLFRITVWPILLKMLTHTIKHLWTIHPSFLHVCTCKALRCASAEICVAQAAPKIGVVSGRQMG